MLDVCLVLMPYASIQRPSIALGLLQASLKVQGLKAKSIYPNLWFAEAIGMEAYQYISDSQPDALIGEWTFSGVAFPDFYTEAEELLTSIAEGSPEELKEAKRMLTDIRREAFSFIDELAGYVLGLSPKIVSCSSVFQQHCACLALLRKIKELDPSIITLMGGANCEANMGRATKREFPWVDFVCSGEGDEVFARLCQTLLNKGPELEPPELPYGVFSNRNLQASSQSQEAPRAMVSDMDRVPVPDYDDYFETLQNSFLSPFINPGLPIETSRGCWWGQRRHCTFCGLNGGSLTYRSKSADRVIKEFAHLSQRYNINKFQVVDNILDMSHINTVLPAFAGLKDGYQIFYETKANLKRHQMEILAKAGVRWLQPGIESMHDQVLKLLDKGNSVAINVQFLKWARELGLLVYWNILMGAPGESDSWYQEMLAWLPQIIHLQPPTCAGWIRYDRFSPYFENPDHWGLELAPNKHYSLIYPLDQQSIFDLVYYFEDQAAATSDAQINPLFYFHQPRTVQREKVNKWCEKWMRVSRSNRAPILSYAEAEGATVITDTRPCAVQSEHVLLGLEREIYQACDRALSSDELETELEKSTGKASPPEQIEAVLKSLTQRKLMLNLHGRHLSLALRRPVPALPTPKESPAGHLDLQGFREFVQDAIRNYTTDDDKRSVPKDSETEAGSLSHPQAVSC